MKPQDSRFKVFGAGLSSKTRFCKLSRLANAVSTDKTQPGGFGRLEVGVYFSKRALFVFLSVHVSLWRTIVESVCVRVRLVR